MAPYGATHELTRTFLVKPRDDGVTITSNWFRLYYAAWEKHWPRVSWRYREPIYHVRQGLLRSCASEPLIPVAMSWISSRSGKSR
jgi:hypothetical protein